MKATQERYHYTQFHTIKGHGSKWFYSHNILRSWMVCHGEWSCDHGGGKTNGDHKEWSHYAHMTDDHEEWSYDAHMTDDHRSDLMMLTRPMITI